MDTRDEVSYRNRYLAIWRQLTNLYFARLTEAA
jgi:hypothetical protein